MDNNTSMEHLRKYIWDYFELHAKQRLTTFNYYIVISTLIATGYLIVIKDIPILSLILSIILILLSLIFWKLDIRNKQLINNSENALKYIESKDAIGDKNNDEPHILNIFRYEEKQTSKMKREKTIWFWRRVYTYSTCLNAVFIIFALLGLFGVIYSILTLV